MEKEKYTEQHTDTFRFPFRSVRIQHKSYHRRFLPSTSSQIFPRRPPLPPDTTVRMAQPPFDPYYLYQQDDRSNINTLFVSGLPDDVKAREIHNLFRRRPGFDSCQLKYTGRANQVPPLLPFFLLYCSYLLITDAFEVGFRVNFLWIESKLAFFFRSWRLLRFSTTNRQWQRCTPWMWVPGGVIVMNARVRNLSRVWINLFIKTY